jgi:hypothetical protein
MDLKNSFIRENCCDEFNALIYFSSFIVFPNIDKSKTVFINSLTDLGS